MVLGFASFPLFTRIFSVADYGTINLITNTVLLLTVLSKFGFQHAIQRFYPEFANSSDPNALPRYYATLFWGTAAIAISLTLAFIVTVPLGSVRFLGIAATGAFLLALSLVTIRALRSMQMNLLQMEGKTRLFNVMDIVTKAAVITATCLLLFVWQRSLFAFFLGLVAVESIVFLQYMPFLVRRGMVSPRMFDLQFFRSALAFSSPLMAAEISWVVLDSGDRFFVRHYLGAQALGYYAAAYGVATYLQDVLMSPLQLALFPVCMKTWSDKGERATQELLSRSLDQFAMVAVLVVSGAMVTSREVIVMLASQKFQEAHVLLPFLVIGLVFSAVTIFFRPGLLIHKRASKVATATFLATILNIVLNIVLLPRIGLVGAALATVLSYTAVVIFLARESFKVLPFRLELKSLARYALAGLAAAWLASHVGASTHVTGIVLKGGLIVLSYTGILWLIDQRARGLMNLTFRAAFSAVRPLKNPAGQGNTGPRAVVDEEAVVNQ